MATTQLKLYNRALTIIGERELASLSENREPRRALDLIWDGGAFITACLQQGFWTFATRTIQISYDPSISPDFGYQYAFPKPDDYVRTAGVATDEFFTNPLSQYSDEGGFWFSNNQTLYIKYISNDPAFGNDLSLWPEAFTRYAESSLALQISTRIVQDNAQLDRITKSTMRLLTDARSKDAMNEGAKFPPRGMWLRARTGQLFGRIYNYQRG